jgi:2-keto-4-pentenoate hydratase
MCGPPRTLVSALERQLDGWRQAQRDGARRLGWKIGGDIAEIEQVTGGAPTIGHLTSATLIAEGDRYDAGGAALHADTELFLELESEIRPGCGAEAASAAVGRFGAALELVDLSRPSHDAAAIVEANVFHRAFALGPSLPLAGSVGGVARSVVNGEIRAAEQVLIDPGATVVTVSRWLAAVGEWLVPGDRILAGAITQVPARPGDTVRAEIDGVGAVSVTLAG